MGSGLDRIAQGERWGLEGRRVALLVNHTAITRDGRHAVEALRSRGDIEIVRLLGPEHGVWGTHQDMEAVAAPTLDPVFGLPAVSLYGADVASLAPSPEVLRDVDAVVYDIQDIGARYYTYAATLALTMEVAAAQGVPVWVLDRDNPLGDGVEGPPLEAGYESFCGLCPGLPIRHGMTVGGLAQWYRRRRAPTCELHIVPCTPGPSPWVPPSPNMPTRETAWVYPGMCLLEGTSLSEGRGTTAPFLQFGAPDMDALGVARELRRRLGDHATFAPVMFRPAFQKHAGAVCRGVYMDLRDPASLPTVGLGVHVLSAVKRVSPASLRWRADAYEFVEDVPAIDLLWGSAELREAIDADRDVVPLLSAAQARAEAFDAAL